MATVTLEALAFVMNLMVADKIKLSDFIEEADLTPEALAAVKRWNAWYFAKIEHDEREKRREFTERCGALRIGNRNRGDSRVWWWAFPADLTDDEINARLEAVEVYTGPLELPPSAYDCSGRWFGPELEIERKPGKRIALAKLYRYQDV
jgi:hypothetical protein